jgi:hypothetical protein
MITAAACLMDRDLPDPAKQVTQITNLQYMKAVCKVCGLTLLLQVGTLWRCSDGLFFEVPPLASDALLTMLHPLLENML